MLLLRVAFIGFITGVKVRYLLGLIVAWNAWCAVGIYLNGGQGRIRTTASAVALVSAVVVFAGAFFALRSSTSLQEVVLKESADVEAVENFALHAGITFAALAVVFAIALSVQLAPY